MAKYLIEDIQVGVTAGGMACGPIPGNVVTEMKVRNTEDDSVIFYGITEVMGIHNFTKSEESLYDIQMSDTDDEDAWKKVYDADVGIESIYDLTSGDSSDPKAAEEVSLWKLLMFFVRAGWDDVNQMKPKCIGKYLEEIEIPVYEDDDEDEDEEE